MEKHTPGPWKWIFPTDHSDDMPSLVGSNGKEIMNFGNCASYYPQEGSAPNEADALLIEYAPAMLESLEYFVNRVEAGTIKSTTTYNKFKELINKIKL